MKKALTAQFIKIHPNAVIPEYKTAESAGCDIYMPESFSLLPREQQLISTGLICIPPSGYHWEVYLRSSATLKWLGLTLANCVGIIDSDYCGPDDELKLNLLNQSSDRILVIKQGDRLCQIILRKNIRPNKMKEIDFKQIYQKKSRGGFGSTGT